jgi:hypothetical protein
VRPLSLRSRHTRRTVRQAEVLIDCQALKQASLKDGYVDAILADDATQHLVVCVPTAILNLQNGYCSK